MRGKWTLSWALACLVLLCGPVMAQDKTAGPDLPIRRVILYKHGVGYFERMGSVEGDSKVTLSFKAKDMSDLLKSLTVFDLSGGSISTIAYDSTKTVDQQLGEYTFNLRNARSLPDILAQMKGSQISLKVDEIAHAGRILAVERRDVITKDGKVQRYRLSMLLKNGMVKAWDLNEVTDLQFTDAELQKELAKYLATLFSQHRRDEKKVSIFATGKGKRNIFASYVQEQPIWKVSYRIVTGKKDETLLQAWAIVDNVSGADWENVELALVSGLPVSFRQNLYDPHFVLRPLIQLQRETAGGPVVYAGGADMDDAGMENAKKAKGSGRRRGLGRDKADEKEFASARAPGKPYAKRPPMNMMKNMAKQAARAVAQEAGALFVYNIDKPVTIKRDRSALLPIANSKVKADRIAIYNERTRAKNPMDGLRITNTTGLTLEGGPVTVIEGNTYVGEALIDTLKPDEERYISFAVDLGTKVDPKFGSHTEKVYLVTISNGVMIQHYKQRSTKIYNLNNVENKAKTIVIEHPIRHGWKLITPAKAREKTNELYRFEVKLVPKEKEKFDVVEERANSRRFYIQNISTDQIRVFLQQKYIDRETRDFLQKIVGLQGQIAALNRTNSNLRSEQTRIFRDQQRLRGNLSSLGNRDIERKLRSRYVTQWNAQEDRLTTIKNTVKANDAKRRALETQMRKLVNDFSFRKAL
jgi:hypothetical protein